MSLNCRIASLHDKWRTFESRRYETLGHLSWSRVLVMTVLLLTGVDALSQVEIERPTAGKRNSVGVSTFVGPNLTQDTYLYGVAAQYDRLLASKWDLAVSVNADWAPTEVGKNEHSLSFALDGGYSLTEQLSVNLAYVKGFAIYSSETNYRWNWVNGDNAVGIGASYTLWERDRHSLDLSAGVERNLTISETSINFALGYAFSF